MDNFAKEALVAFNDNLWVAALTGLFFAATTILCLLQVRTYWREHGRFMSLLYSLNLIALVVFTGHIGTTILHLRIIPTEAGALMCMKVLMVSGALLFIGNLAYTVVLASILCLRRMLRGSQ